jgi:hypothetical protein
MIRLKCDFDFIYAYVEKKIREKESIRQMAICAFFEENVDKLILKAAKEYYKNIRYHPDFRKGSFLWVITFEEFLETILEVEEETEIPVYH